MHAGNGGCMKTYEYEYTYCTVRIIGYSTSIVFTVRRVVLHTWYNDLAGYIHEYTRCVYS